MSNILNSLLMVVLNSLMKWTCESKAMYSSFVWNILPEISITRTYQKVGLSIQSRPSLFVKLIPGPTWSKKIWSLMIRVKFSDRGQTETDRNDENAMCDYFSEFFRMHFRLGLYKGSSRSFLNILRTKCFKRWFFLFIYNPIR